MQRVLAHWARSAVHLDTIRAWIGDDGNPALQEVLAVRPSILTSIVHPYLHSAWTARRKLQAIADHYQLLQGRLGFLRATTTRPIELADLGDRLKLRVEAPGQFAHEGQLVLNLKRDEVRLYSLAFMWGHENGEPVAYIGALQGVHDPDALQTYRDLTHRMHGLRPRDLLVTAFRAFCRSLGFGRILAVSDLMRVSTNRYFDSSSQVFASYDAVWLENGGSAAGSGFFGLDTCPTIRSSEDIPSRKRAQYRRRYALVSDLAGQIARNVSASAT